MGSLDKEIVRRVVKRRSAQVRFCYERALRTSPDLEGRVSVKFVIEAAGTVSASTATATAGMSTAVANCVAAVFKSMRFPAAGAGGAAIVTYPLVFRADEGSAVRAPPPPPSVVVERNTPALFGIGLIDAIPDEVIEAAAATSIAGHPEITGKLGRTSEGRVTRFGWKADVADLVTFVSRACSVEVGLEVPGSPQPGRKRKGAPTGFDLDLDDLEDLVAYVRALPAPVERRAGNAQASRGAELFDGIGCTACHRPALGDVDGLYSDLLLHDMGSELDDNASVGYYGSPPVGGSNEWRTPPLWGARDSAPYMHDGRAKTLQRAIALHGGEAWRTRQSYYALDDAGRAALIAFLESLQAPPP
jgi:hypothetical protein